MADYSTHNPQDIILLNKIKDELVELNQLAPSLLESESEPKGAMPLQTGQTTSYATGDDGDLQRGRLVDYRTLPYNNGFGNTERFTDELGGQTFTKKIIIDWSTWDGGTDVKAYIISSKSDIGGILQDWPTWMSGQPYTTGGFGDWYVINNNEMYSIFNFASTHALGGYPFSQTFTGNDMYYTSTTYYMNPNQAFYKNRYSSWLTGASKTKLYRTILVRTFNWDGASLT